MPQAAADLGRWNWWPSFKILLTPDGSPPNITDGQVVAVIYMALTIIVQLNILSTRNTSVWFWWSKKTAPPPSLKLAVPVIAFLVGATFIAGKTRILIALYWQKLELRSSLSKCCLRDIAGSSASCVDIVSSLPCKRLSHMFLFFHTCEVSCDVTVFMSLVILVMILLLH